MQLLEDTLSNLIRENIESYDENFCWRDRDKSDDDVTIFGLTEFVIEFREITEDMNVSEFKQRLNTTGIMCSKNSMNVVKILFDNVHSFTIDEPILLDMVNIEISTVKKDNFKSIIASYNK